jgi:hypothetical protein
MAINLKDPLPEIKRPPSNLQSRILQDDELLRKKREESKAEMLSRLPEMPHEIELKKELADEEELLNLYKEVARLYLRVRREEKPGYGQETRNSTEEGN